MARELFKVFLGPATTRRPPSGFRILESLGGVAEASPITKCMRFLATAAAFQRSAGHAPSSKPPALLGTIRVKQSYPAIEHDRELRHVNERSSIDKLSITKFTNAD